jgi:hypothetical protein
VRNEFFARMEELRFPTVSGVRVVEIAVTALDFNSELGGLPPDFWGSSFPDYAVVYSVEAYAPGASVGRPRA